MIVLAGCVRERASVVVVVPGHPHGSRAISAGWGMDGAALSTALLFAAVVVHLHCSRLSVISCVSAGQGRITDEPSRCYACWVVAVGTGQVLLALAKGNK